jgi:hypothetical protein
VSCELDGVGCADGILSEVSPNREFEVIDVDCDGAVCVATTGTVVASKEERNGGAGALLKCGIRSKFNGRGAGRGVTAIAARLNENVAVDADGCDVSIIGVRGVGGVFLESITRPRGVRGAHRAHLRLEAINSI